MKGPVPLESVLGAEEASLDVELDTGRTLDLGWLAKAWGLTRGGLLLRVLGSLGELLLCVLGGLLGHAAGDRLVTLVISVWLGVMSVLALMISGWLGVTLVLMISGWLGVT